MFDHYEVAVFFIGAGGSVVDSLLERTRLHPQGLTGLADGLLVASSSVNASGLVLRGHARAGIMYDKSEGDITGCLVTDNLLGLVNQGAPGAQVLDDNVIEGNETDIYSAAELAISDEALDIPVSD